MTTITVSSGTRTVSTVIPSSTDFLVESHGVLDVVHGGVVTGTTISNGGSELVSSGATVNATTIDNGGTENVHARYRQRRDHQRWWL